MPVCVCTCVFVCYCVLLSLHTLLLFVAIVRMSMNKWLSVHLSYYDTYTLESATGNCLHENVILRQCKLRSQESKGLVIY